MNVAVVRGELDRPVNVRELPSGESVASFELRVSNEGRTETVPISWPGSPPAATDHEPGDELLVVGRVRRRFYQVAGAIQSRTEVVAGSVVPARQRKRVERLLTTAATELWPV